MRRYPEVTWRLPERGSGSLVGLSLREQTEGALGLRAQAEAASCRVHLVCVKERPIEIRQRLGAGVGSERAFALGERARERALAVAGQLGVIADEACPGCPARAVNRVDRAAVQVGAHRGRDVVVDRLAHEIVREDELGGCGGGEEFVRL